MKFLAAILPLLMAVTAVASTFNDDVLGELALIKSVYHAEYAPAEWKKQFANYDLETEYAKAMAAVQANPHLTVKDSREIFKNFIYAMKDYHTSISFVSTEKASLPLTIRGTLDHYYLVFIDRTKLTEAAFPFQVGDEVVTFGGVATADAVNSVQAEIPANVPGTDHALAEMYLTSRTGSHGLNVPQGPITLGIRRVGSQDIQNYQLIWNYTPEKIHSRGDLGSLYSLDMTLPSMSLFHPRMDVKLDVDAAPAPVTNPYTLGGRESFIPALGNVVWKNDGTIFSAYIYKTADGKEIGYLRIPQYEADDYMAALTEFQTIVTTFEGRTQALVIDQVNNPGGSVFYLYALASMLAKQPLATPRHRMSITQADVSDALTQIDGLSAIQNDADAQKVMSPKDNDGYPVSYEFAQFSLNYARFVVSEWNAGRKLTNPYWIGGVDHINPAASHYTKPILLLTNHLDFSGGDFFPAIMQDNQRVTIMGTRTAGAGGYVNDISVQ